MTNQEKMALLMMVYEAIFTSKAANQDITNTVVRDPSLMQWVGNQYQQTGIQNGRWFVNGTLRGFDLSIKAGERILLIRVLEQNPNKTDAAGNLKRTALLAQQGHKIAWVIDRRQENGWLGSVRNGEWHPSQPQATYPAVNTSTLPHNANLTNQAADAETQFNIDLVARPDSADWADVDIDELPDISNHTATPEAVLRYYADEAVNELDEEYA